MNEFTQNLRYAARTLRRSPLFTTVAVLSLALGIGANTAVFSFLRAVVLKQLAVPGADRLVILRQHNETFHIENCCFVYRFFQEIRKKDVGFDAMAAVRGVEVNMTDRDETEKLQAELVSGNYFGMLAVRPAAGRLIRESDDQTEGAAPVCAISYRLWQERYAGQSGVIGRWVLINNEPYRIVGVSEPGFTGASLHEPHDLQIPAAMAIRILGQKRDSFGWAEIIARLKPGVTRVEALARLNATGLQLQRAAGFQVTDRDTFSLIDGSQGTGSRKEQYGKPVQVLLLLVAVVLLIACANLAALSMVRSAERAREAGVRVALGASRVTLMRRFLTESLILAAAGGACGWLAAHGLIRTLLAFLGDDARGLAGMVRPDAAVFAFCAGISIAAGLLFGLLPAWRASQANPMQAIRGGGVTRAGKPIASRVLMAAQVALSLALLFAAGLFGRTLRNLRSIDLGFRPENVVVLHVDLSGTPRAGNGAGPFFEELLRRVREMPGARAASLTSISALSGSMMSTVLRIPGYAPPDRLTPVTYMTTISSSYFRTLGIPLLAGRDFTADDRGSGEGAAIVNQQFARKFLGGNALGKTFSYGGGRKVHVIGVASDVKFRRVKEEPQPVMYVPVTQWTYPESLYLQVRTAGDPEPAIGRLRWTVRDIDRRVPIESITTMALQIDRALSRERLLAFLSSLMGGLAVALAAIGLYGVLSFSVARRTREIGIRMAVGAPRERILALFLRECAWIVVCGIAAGIPLALAAGRLASSLLYGLKPRDLSTAAAATAILALAALAAAMIPARRASRVDPLAALREE
jgi:predicted permease